MKRIAVAVMMCAMVFCYSGIAIAQSNLVEYDPLKRNLLFVEGDAEKEFPVNIFRLRFGFDIQKGNFSDADSSSRQIIDRITASVQKLGLTNVNIIKGWDVVKQGKISIGASGSKLSNQLIVEVRDFPADKMQESITRIIDSSLAVGKEVFLEGVEVNITKEVEDVYKEEVLMQALKSLKANAEKAAETQGKRIMAAKRIFVLNSQEAVNAATQDMCYETPRTASVMRQSYISVQKGFTVRSNITDHLKISSRVSGIYEIE